MTSVIKEDPKVAFNRLLREFLYGLISFAISSIFIWVFGFLTTGDYKWLIPLIQSFQHFVVKALEEYNIKPIEKFKPFYEKIWETLKGWGNWVKDKVKK